VKGSKCVPLVKYSCSVNTMLYITDQHMCLHCGVWVHVGTWRIEAAWSDLFIEFPVMFLGSTVYCNTYHISSTLYRHKNQIGMNLMDFIIMKASVY